MSEIKVKALEWEPGGGDGKMSQRATVIGLRYYVYKNDEDGIWRSYTEGYQMASFGEFFTEEGAKAAAQSDFDARIRSALVERKAEPGDGVRDAAARHCGLVRAAHGGPFRKLPDIFDAFIAGANWRADAALSASPSPVDSRDKAEPDRSKFPYCWEGPKPPEGVIHQVINAYMGEQDREYDVYQFRYYLANWHHHYTLNQRMKAAVDALLAAKEQQP